jgi:hypothetical protein
MADTSGMLGVLGIEHGPQFLGDGESTPFVVLGRENTPLARRADVESHFARGEIHLSPLQRQHFVCGAPAGDRGKANHWLNGRWKVRQDAGQLVGLEEPGACVVLS